MRHSHLHVLMISDVYFPRVNGVSTSIRTFAHSFLLEGHQVTLIAPGYDQSCEDDFEIIRIPSRRVPFDPEDHLMSRKAVRSIIPMLEQRHFDVVHIQTPFVAHYAGVEIAARLQLPVITSYHTFFEAYFEKYLPWLPSGMLRSLARSYSKKQCSQVDGIVAPSRQMLNRLREYGIATRAAVIPTGLVLEDFSRDRNNTFKQDHGIDEDTDILLYVGRVAFEKNIEFLIDVFERISERRPGTKLLIAGEGPALPKLKARARSIGLEKEILFVGYLERRKALIDCYQSSSLFVFASETETQGLVLLEAMASGLPVVSTVCMGTRDVLKNGEGCVIAEPNISDFSTKVIALLNDQDEIEKLSRSALDYVGQWTTGAKAADMLNFYEQVSQAYNDSGKKVVDCLAERLPDG